MIVSYNPVMDALRHLAKAIAPQFYQLLVVDNSGVDVGLIRLDDNYGIARAQNIGIERARANGSDYVLLLDQESVPAGDMVATLLSAVSIKQAEGLKVACVGYLHEPGRNDRCRFSYRVWMSYSSFRH